MWDTLETSKKRYLHPILIIITFENSTKVPHLVAFLIVTVFPQIPVMIYLFITAVSNTPIFPFEVAGI